MVARHLKLNLRLVLLSVVNVVTLAAIQQPSPSSSSPSSLEVSGLQDQVTVRRDERGIPYIQAKNDHDLYLAQGYITASDRLWQMDLFRRTARGELAEVLGKNALEEDKRHRTFGFAQAAEAEVSNASAKARAVLEAYAQGVNAYIASLTAKSLPPEFQTLQYQPRPWTPADSLIIIKLFFESLSSSWRLDVMREALADLPPEKLARLLPETSPLDVLVMGTDGPSKRTSVTAENVNRFSGTFTAQSFAELAADLALESRSLSRLGLESEGLAASNNWVVSGKRTTSGKPLLANDPHLAPSAPSIWYLVHLTAPGVRVAGVTAAGLPGVAIGHNNDVAWGFTNVGPDVQDLYVEKVDPENSQRYLTPNGWRDFDVRHEQIKVRKGFTETSADIVPLDVRVTRHGPIVFERPGKPYALRWTALDPKLNEPSGFYTINRARNWQEFTDALKTFTGPTQNMVYADVGAHIGYYAAGVVPVRKSGDGSVPYDGSTDAGEWTSFVPCDKLPHVLDPPADIIVTANQRIVGTDYAFFLTHSWAPPYRAHRIMELLQKKQKLSADDFRDIQGDIYSIAGVTFARSVSKTLSGQLNSTDDDKLRQTITAFEQWDGRLNADSTIAPLLAQMRTAFRSRIINNAVGEERANAFGWPNFDTTVDFLIQEQPTDWLPKEFKTYKDLVRACYQDARQSLTKSLGEDESKWTWGNMVKTRFPHPLAVAPLVGLQFTIAPFPQNGTGFLVGASVNVGSSVSMRLIADPSDWDKTQQGIALGESGLPSSPHWNDQLQDWRDVKPRAFPFTDQAITKATKETITLEPKHAAQ